MDLLQNATCAIESKRFRGRMVGHYFTTINNITGYYNDWRVKPTSSKSSLSSSSKNVERPPHMIAEIQLDADHTNKEHKHKKSKGDKKKSKHEHKKETKSKHDKKKSKKKEKEKKEKRKRHSSESSSDDDDDDNISVDNNDMN